MTDNHDIAPIPGPTDIDFEVAKQNAHDHGDPRMFSSLIKLMRSNPRFMHCLITEAQQRSTAAQNLDPATARLYADAFLEGAAVVLAVQQQHLSDIEALEAHFTAADIPAGPELTAAA